MTKKDFVASWAEKLPPYIARQEVAWFLGGVIAQDTLAKADSDGRGPKGAQRVSNRVVYPTQSLLEWLCDRGYADISAPSKMLDSLRKMSRDRAMSPRILPADLPQSDEHGVQDACI